MATAAVPNGHPSAAGDDSPPPPPQSSSSSSSSLVFLGTGCSSAVPNARCLIQPSDPPCAVCSQSLSVPPELNPNYRCNTSLLIDYCQDEGAHKYIIIDVGKTFREQVLRWFVCHKIPCVDSMQSWDLMIFGLYSHLVLQMILIQPLFISPNMPWTAFPKSFHTWSKRN